jgi:putative component of toxin-antitoxin plasmid stabilization module
MGMHIQTHRLMGGIYELHVEMGSGAIPSFTKTGSDIQMFMCEGGTTDTQTA